VPALVVLREDLPKVVDGVAVVPVLQLADFVRNLDVIVQELGIKGLIFSGSSTSGDRPCAPRPRAP